MAGNNGRQDWKQDGLCASQPPDLWDLDFYNFYDLPFERPGKSRPDKIYRSVASVASELCKGCPVMRECALEALQPMWVGRQGGGIDMHGVIRAGVPMHTTGGNNRSMTPFTRRRLLKVVSDG